MDSAKPSDNSKQHDEEPKKLDKLDKTQSTSHQEAVALREMSLSEKLFSFNGRLGIGSYWAILISCFVFSLVTTFILRAIGNEGFALLVALLLIIPGIWISLALYSKRWHDMNLSGLFTLTLFIPFVNFLIMVCLGFIPGTAGANRYGPAPDIVGTGPLTDEPQEPFPPSDDGQLIPNYITFLQSLGYKVIQSDKRWAIQYGSEATISYAYTLDDLRNCCRTFASKHGIQFCEDGPDVV